MKLYRQLILLALTLLVLVSSTGISVGMHLCGGQLRDINFFGEASDCPMEQPQEEKLPPCHTSPKDQTTTDNCCEDHQLLIERPDVTSGSEAIILSKALDLKFISAVSVIILQLFAPQVSLKPAYALYTSPPVVRDIPVLGHTFLL